MPISPVVAHTGLPAAKVNELVTSANDQETALGAVPGSISGAVAAHVAAVDPHGDRVYAGTTATTAANNAVATHVAAVDPHGDRAYTDAQILTVAAGGWPAVWFLTPADCTGTPMAVRSQIQAVLSGITVPTRVVTPSMPIVIGEGTHPNTVGSGGFRTALAIKSFTDLFISRGCTFQLANVALVSETRMFTNWKCGTGGVSDTDVSITGEGYWSVIDGNCGASNINGQLVKCHGIQWWQAIRPSTVGVRVKDNNGWDTGATNGEAFTIDHIRCQDFLVKDCVAERSTGDVATLFSCSFGDLGRFVNCIARGSNHGHGFACYSISRLLHINCIAENNGSVGFNEEHCWDVTYTGCYSGGRAMLVTDSTAITSFAVGAAHGNVTGFNINTTKGGGNIKLVGCTSAFNQKGLTLLGAVSSTAAAGTTASTIVSGTAGFFTSAMRNRWVQVAGGNPVQITGYTNGTTVTTSAPHGGVAGDLIAVWGGQVDVDSTCSFHDSSTVGVAFTASGAVNKHNDHRMLRFAPGVSFYNNAAEMWDVGYGAAGATGTLASAAPGTILASSGSGHLAGWTSGVAMCNPFPFDVALVVVGGTATTTIGAKYSPNTLVSAGHQTGVSILPAGVTFLATAASIKMLMI